MAFTRKRRLGGLCGAFCLVVKISENIPVNAAQLSLTAKSCIDSKEAQVGGSPRSAALAFEV